MQQTKSSDYASVNLHKDYHSTPDLKKSNQDLSQQSQIINELNRKNLSSVSRDDQELILNSKSKVSETQRGYFTLPSRPKKSGIRPTFSQEKTLPPPDHPPPPIPVTQLVPVDTSNANSDYASVNHDKSDVMSSFKPSDNAKLYASPENRPGVVFREKNPNPNTTSPNKKKMSPTRTQSMPARNRPEILRRNSEVETYSINGVNYTTYTTFRSPITPDEIPEKQFEAVKNEPEIPEPDYDLSDAEIRAIKSNDRFQKKKKSVSFVMDDEEIGTNKVQKKTKKPESILKDPSRNSIDSSGLGDEKYSHPIDRIPQAKLKQVKVSESDKVRIAVATNDMAKMSLNRSNSVSYSSNTNDHALKASLHKSPSFSAEKHLSEAASGAKSGISENDLRKARSQLKPSRSFPNEFNEEGDNSSSGVSSDQDVNDTKFVTYLRVDSSGQNTWDNSKINSMKQILHPKLQALFDAKPNSSSTLPSNMKLKRAQLATTSVDIDLDSTMSSMSSNSSNSSSHYKTLPNRKKIPESDSRTIGESLALIQQHVSEVNSTIGQPSEAVVLAPPPGFSDSESFSDNDSMTGHKFGFNKVNQTSFVAQSLSEQMRRSKDSPMSRSFTNGSTSNSSSFEKKPLIGWTTGDVCAWLDSLFIPEYKTAFLQNKVDGMRLTGMTKGELEKLGVVRVAHVMSIEKSLKKFVAK